MYGKISALPTTAGAALIPFAGSNKVLFAVAAGLVLGGLTIFTISTVLARTSQNSAK